MALGKPVAAIAALAHGLVGGGRVWLDFIAVGMGKAQGFCLEAFALGAWLSGGCAAKTVDTREF